jgi:signal transduction histidine kinase
MAAVGDLTGSGRALLYALAAVHTGAALLIQRTGGPFTRADGWTVLWIGAVIVVPLLSAHLLRPEHYADDPNCVALCSYPAAPVLFFAFYPWLTVERGYLRPATELLLVLAVVVEPLLIVQLLTVGPVPSKSYLSVGVSGAWNVLAFLAGKTVGRLFRKAAQLQMDLQRRDYQEFFDFLHSEVEGALAVIQREDADRAGVADELRRLYNSLTKRRIKMQMAEENVRVAAVFAETLRTYAGVLTIAESPRPGMLTLPRPLARMIQRTLGDLLKNATQHGATQVEVRFRIDDRDLHLEVDDDGPGLDPAVLDDPARSLHKLRADARELGGELRCDPATTRGTRLRLTLPFPR